VAAAVACGWRWRNPSSATASPMSSAVGSAAISRWARYPVVLASAVGVVVVVGTVAPLVAHWTGERTLSIGGEFFARLIAPLALAAVAVLGVFAISGSRRLVASAGWLSHAGFVIVVVGVVATTFDRSGTATLGDGESAEIAGLMVINEGVTVRAGRRDGTDEVAVSLNVAGYTMSPALTAYPERGGILAETALVSRPWRDVQAVLLDADDTGRAVIEVRNKPLVQLVWLGALTVAIGTMLASRRSSGRDLVAVVASDRTPDAVEASDHVQ
jgi:cytochrome c biogenesis factor